MIPSSFLPVAVGHVLLASLGHVAVLLVLVSSFPFSSCSQRLCSAFIICRERDQNVSHAQLWLDLPAP